MCDKKDDLLSQGYNLVNFCEFDKYASRSYCAIHNVDESLNLGDITQVDETNLKAFNVICGGSPCQDFSIAGKQNGSKWECCDCGHSYNPLTVHYSKRNTCPMCGSTNLNKTRSSLLVEWLRIIRANRPKWGIYENVKNLTGKSFKVTFQMFLDELKEYGYNTYYKVLNAKDFGVPQNRERVYVVFIRKELDNLKFKFPEGFSSKLVLKDVMDKVVEDKYYVSNEILQKFELANEIGENNDALNVNTDKPKLVGGIGKKNFGKQYRQGNRVYSSEHIAMCLLSSPIGNTGGYSYLYTIREMIKEHNRNAKHQQDLLQIDTDICRCIPAGTHGSTPHLLKTVKTTGECIKIRRLTPKECFRLMGFSDNDFNNARQSGISNTQLYKQAGNSIVVDVLYYILKSLYNAMPKLFVDIKLGSYFSGIGAFEKALNRLFDTIKENEVINE